MNRIVWLLVLIVLIGFLFENRKTIIENYSAGTGIQLLTSKPYYTWYDYYTQMARYPYSYGYRYGYPYYGYGYGSQYGYPYYEPTYLPYYF